MKKALIVTNTASMIKLFNQLNIAILQSMGYEVHVGCNFCDGNTISSDEVNRAMEEWKTRGIFVHQIDVPRNPLSCETPITYKQIKKLLRHENFSLIHCQTPVAAALTRIAAAKSYLRKQTRVVYTAHGFHFFKGAPWKNWLLYYPVEKICSYFTDEIITINREDYEIAEEKFSSALNHYLPGVGVDTKKFSPNILTPEARDTLRKSLGVKPGQRMILSVGELIPRKNYHTAIDIIARLRTINIRYVICGQGELLSEMQEYAKAQNVADCIAFLGYRKDIPQICSCADVFLHTSFQEGLPVAVMEAMASGIPIVASRIRGNVDLIEDGVNGFLCDPRDVDGFADKIRKILDDPDLDEELRSSGLQKIRGFDVKIVTEKLKKIYCGARTHDNAAL